MSCPPRIITAVPDGSVLRLTVIPTEGAPDQFRSFADFQVKPIDPPGPAVITRWKHEEIVAPSFKGAVLRSGKDYAIDPIQIVFNSAKATSVHVHLEVTAGGQIIIDEVICKCSGTNGIVCRTSVAITLSVAIPT